MQEELKQLIKQFLEETERERTVYNGNLKGTREPQFIDFVVWATNLKK